MLSSGRNPIAQIPPSAPGSSSWQVRQTWPECSTDQPHHTKAPQCNTCRHLQRTAARYMVLLLHCKEINVNCQRNPFFVDAGDVAILGRYRGKKPFSQTPEVAEVFSAWISSLGQGSNQPMQPFVIFQ